MKTHSWRPIEGRTLVMLSADLLFNDCFNPLRHWFSHSWNNKLTLVNSSLLISNKNTSCGLRYIHTFMLHLFFFKTNWVPWKHLSVSIPPCLENVEQPNTTFERSLVCLSCSKIAYLAGTCAYSTSTVWNCKNVWKNGHIFWV